MQVALHQSAHVDAGVTRSKSGMLGLHRAARCRERCFNQTPRPSHRSSWAALAAAPPAAGGSMAMASVIQWCMTGGGGAALTMRMRMHGQRCLTCSTYSCVHLVGAPPADAPACVSAGLVIKCNAHSQHVNLALAGVACPWVALERSSWWAGAETPGAVAAHAAGRSAARAARGGVLAPPPPGPPLAAEIKASTQFAPAHHAEAHAAGRYRRRQRAARREVPPAALPRL